jgi:hypothetical protein
MPNPGLRPQDVFVLAKLLSYQGGRPSMAQMGMDLSISPSEVHAALQRLTHARLVAGDTDGHRPLLAAVAEFLVHGVKYAFPPKRGGITRGLPTSYAAPPLNRDIDAGSDPPPVWPCADGSVRGVALDPLHKSAPDAARRDPVLYEYLALIDALREGRARERTIAEKELLARLGSHRHAEPQPRASRRRR